MIPHRLRPHLLAASLSLAAAAAFAQTPAAGEARPSQAQAEQPAAEPAKRLARMQQRLDALKQKLQLSAAQESAWASFTSAMRPAGPHQRPDREALQRMTTPERIDHLRALRQERMAEMERRGEATKAFYAALTPEQQKIFDAETARRHRHGGKRGHHG